MASRRAAARRRLAGRYGRSRAAILRGASKAPHGSIKTGSFVTTRTLEFGPYRLDVPSRRLRRSGELIPITPKALDALLMLLERPDRVLEKSELMQALWPDTHVEEANLAQTVFVLRKVLGERPEGGPYVETVPRKGYRFAAEVREIRDDLPPTAVAAESSTVVAAPPAGRRLARWLAAPAIGVVALVALGIAAHQVRVGNNAGRPSAEPGPRSLAVLPFQRLGPLRADDEYLGIGMADALITQLGNVRQLIVRPTAAVRRYDGVGRDPGKAGRELGVDWVVDGSIQHADGRLRTSVQLIRSADGVPVWTERFDTRWTDIFTVQDSIAAQVAEALALRLTADERRQLAKRYTKNPRAHELYLRSRYFWNKRNAGAFLKAIDYARQAVAEDRGYALAHAGLADSYALLGSLATDALPRSEAMARAKEVALEALAIDETLAEAHTSLAFVLMHYDWNWTESEKEFRRAIELNPGYSTAHHWYAYYLTAHGRHAEAIAEIRKARELDPLSMIINTDVAEIHYYARQYEQAVAHVRGALEIEPDFPLAHYVLGMALVQLRQYDPAIGEFRRAARDRPEVLGHLGYALAVSGRQADARRVLRTIEQMARTRYGMTLTPTGPQIGLGMNDEALARFERAYSEHDGSLILMGVEPMWDPLRSDPRYVELVRRVGVPVSTPAS